VASRGEALSDFSGMQPPYGRACPAGPQPLFLRLLVIFVSVALVGLFFAVSPVARQPAERSAAASPEELPAPAPTVGPAGPRAATVLSLREGPSPEYEVLASLPRGAAVEVVGRSADGEWLALSVAPGSPLYGWAPRRAVIDAPALESLPVRPVVLIDAP
jgi:hypothetical protein